jgi:4-methyl-5(b-hydroxyethyl)-thiazole monophosphate biosynthesis
MPRVCILLAPGFEEIEAVTLIDVLRRADVEVVTLAVGSTASLDVTGSHHIIVRADKALAAGATESWDMVILPGGMPGSANLRDDLDVRALVQKQFKSGRRVGAICAAPIALAAAGILAGKKATSYPGFEKDLAGATYLTSTVVRDGNVVTSRGPGTAFAFAFEIVNELCGRQAAETLRSGMLVAP